MFYAMTFLAGVITGALCLLACLIEWRAKINAQAKELATNRKSAHETLESLKQREAEFNRVAAELKHEREDFHKQKASYQELQGENVILKHDLQNVDVNLRKLEMDGELRQRKQLELDERSNQMAKRYLDETTKAVVSAIGPSNFSACKHRLTDVIRRCRDIGFAIPADEEERLISNLKHEFERAVRAAFEREEQARIRAQIREEERLKREIDRELQQLERERAAIRVALDRALADAQGQHSAEVEQLKARLAEAEEKSKRAMSMAQQTKAGHVYVISNIGAFGKDVFKVGMTRRLEPEDRVSELSSAAVPFPYDVHMMISCDDAPSLENALHRALQKRRINRANPRKEFFRVQIDEIYQIVRKNHGEVAYQADPEALEYNQSLAMPEEDAKYIEAVFDESAGGEIDSDEN